MNQKILYPPFETDSENNQDSNMSLSYDLRRSFDTVSEIHIAQKRLNNQDHNKRNVDGDVKSSNDKDVLQQKKCEAAIHAAVAAEAAIAALSNGIAELEDLLSKEDIAGIQINADGSKSSARVTSNENMEHST